MGEGGGGDRRVTLVPTQGLAALRKGRYSAPMATQDQSLGDYLRELRAKKEWSLLRLSQETGLNYANLSRIENDSIVPTPQTVVTLAEALGADLNLMLELADCLPKQILDRLTARPGTPMMKRAAGGAGKDRASRSYIAGGVAHANAVGLSPSLS